MMKINQKSARLLTIFLIAIPILITLSCKFGTSEKVPLEFKTTKYSENIHLFDNDNYPSFNLDANITLPIDSITYKNLYESMANLYFDSLYNENASIISNLEIMANDLVSEYRGLETEIQIDSVDMGSSFNWEIVKANNIVYQSDQYISILIETFAYMGGAHGNTTRIYYVFDLENQKMLTTEEIFKSGNCENLIQMQKKSLQNEGVELDEFYSENFRCDGNFYLSESGIIFFYNQYEIASYAEGPIQVFLSFDQITPLLKNPEQFNKEEKK